MEAIISHQLTESSVTDYIASNHLVKYEGTLLGQILELIKNNDHEQLEWFESFGSDIRHILMNVNAYRKGLIFGFTDKAFDQYGWLVRPTFLEYEVIQLGDTKNYNSYSEIRIGRGTNHVWTYALSYNFGTAGGGSAISVYDRPFPDRKSALDSALLELKKKFESVVGNTDRSNYNPTVIATTLKAITDYKYMNTQMTLF